jgi:hypothetical protein
MLGSIFWIVSVHVLSWFVWLQITGFSCRLSSVSCQLSNLLGVLIFVRAFPLIVCICMKSSCHLVNEIDQLVHDFHELVQQEFIPNHPNRDRLERVGTPYCTPKTQKIPTRCSLYLYWDEFLSDVRVKIIYKQLHFIQIGIYLARCSHIVVKSNLILLSCHALTPAETPEFYLKLTKICTKQADSMVVSSSLKFNHELCKYLADKLKVAVRSALSFFEPIASWYSKFASHEDRGRSLEIFKLLFVLSKEVEAFIQDCSKDAWVQSAIFLTNVSEHITSLGFDLEFCTFVFSSRRKFGSLHTLTVAEISRLRKAEADIVEEKSHLDQLRLYEDARALLTQSRKPGIADEQQVTFLLERLRGRGLHLSADSSESNHSSRLDRISMSSLKKVQVLGTGSFGDVHKANWLGIEVARKTFHGPSAADFEREVEILEGLRHRNIVSLLWHTRDERKCYTIMELMDGDLYSLIQERLEECGSNGPPFSMSEAVHIMLQVAEGMLFLHEKRIVHRDLKSRNILIKHMKAREVGIKYVHAKVADFGLSRTKEKSMTYSNQTLNQGTTRWMAPEMIKNGNEDDEVEVEGEEVLKYPFKVDVYSFGMVCFEILSGDVPFPSLTPKEVKRIVLGGERPQLPDVCPERLRCLIGACWRPEPNERPRFDDICAELRDLTWARFMTCNCLNFKPSILFASH